MVASRRKDLIQRRRRIEDEGEEEEGSVAAGLEDDSLSEGSVISDADDDADGEGSEISDTTAPERKDNLKSNGVSIKTQQSTGTIEPTSAGPPKPTLGKTMSDTQAMMNGLTFSGEVDEGEEIDFEDTAKEEQSISQPSQSGQDQTKETTPNALGENRRREHEEYRKRRDADPSFVPNRGGFFMHDHRSAAPGQNGFRPFGRGRGRGRGIPMGPSHPARYGRGPIDNDRMANLSSQAAQPTGPSDAPWAHDLHETVAQPEPIPPVKVQPVPSYAQQQSRPLQTRAQPPNRSFSTSTPIGNVQVRVYLSGMSSPRNVPAIKVYRYTRLPHHRPPLRRDKPVRISIPHMQIRYVFPATDRSFVFIPRALRPNQQGFGRIRGRGSFSGGYGGFSSRKTSAYAGSNYSPSVAMSRRSSMARETSADALVSPSGLPLSRPNAIVPEPGKPVVRLPPNAEQPQVLDPGQAADASLVPIVSLPQPLGYPPPQDPTYRENRPAPLPMHAPKPQKTVSVADIESPAFNPPQQQQQQPFHQQMPVQISSQQYQSEAPLYPHSRHPSHPSQASGGTPLSQIPERAIHAQPFQPYPFQQLQAFYPQPYPPPFYYYPPPDPSQAMQHPAAAPAFVPGQPYAYPVPFVPQPPPADEPTTQEGTVAHESNGMVYYYDSSQLAAATESTPSYPPPAFSMPPPPGMMGTTAAPMAYFPQPNAAPFYPQQ